MKCMQTYFGGCGFSGFGDITLFVLFQISFQTMWLLNFVLLSHFRLSKEEKRLMKEEEKKQKELKRLEQQREKERKRKEELKTKNHQKTMKLFKVSISMYMYIYMCNCVQFLYNRRHV